MKDRTMSAVTRMVSTGDILLQVCRGPEGCPNAVLPGNDIFRPISSVLNLKSGIDAVTGEAIAPHRLLAISVSLCPNACSRPQIADIGIIAASYPAVTEVLCTGCGLCLEACREGALELGAGPSVREACLGCGHCFRRCPTGSLAQGKTGYRVLVGGRLGRHPSLGRELTGIYSARDAALIISFCYDLYREYNDGRNEMKRFSDILEERGLPLPPHLQVRS